ncbi:hypothetical protein [Aureivirga sp. CE67]|uniref:hypothetical protein n=1 Tax=Aureivirga sp. CE67 TaxID=1788983 RepID=UPI0018CB7C56|nr:hypothetical protein [Aureivirga sp. CE67]
MNKYLLIFIILLFSQLSFCQTKNYKIDSKIKISISQKNGLSEFNNPYLLDIEVTDEDFNFKTNEKQTFTTFKIVKRNKNYIISKSEEGNYSFFNIKSSQLYYIDFYMSRFLIGGYGKTPSEIKQNSKQMMSLLK